MNSGGPSTQPHKMICLRLEKKEYVMTLEFVHDNCLQVLTGVVIHVASSKCCSQYKLISHEMAVYR